MAASEFEYLVRDVASALVAVGRRMTCTDAAKRARARANGTRTDRDGEDASTQGDDDQRPDGLGVGG